MSRDNKTKFNKISDIFGYIIVSLLFFISRFIPIYIFSFLFSILALIFFPFIPTTYLVLKNLKYNTDLNIIERFVVTIKIWLNLGSFVGEYPYVYRMKKNKVFDYVSIEDHQKIENIRKNNGIIISAHLSNWEFGLRALNDLDIKTNVVFRKLNNPYIESSYTAKLREEVGIGMIAKQENAALRIVRSLKNNENVVILVDQKDSMNGVLVNFFKNKAYTIRTVYSISKKLKVPVYAIRIVRTGFIKFILKVEELDTDFDNEIEFLENMNSLLERWIKENISQWFWVHNRWKV